MGSENDLFSTRISVQGFLLNCRRATFILLALVATGIAARAQSDSEPGAADPIAFGWADAAIKIEVFVDFQCPSCAIYNKHIIAIRRNYPKKAHVILRHFPLISFHDKAMIAAQAAEAANSQGKAREMIDMLLGNQKSWSTDARTKMFLGYARKLGLNLEKYRNDFSSAETLDRIKQDIARARSLKVDATPTVFLNGRAIAFSEALAIESLVANSN